MIGWNRGTDLLPFVPVADVATAMLGVLRAEGIEGRCFNLVGGMRRPIARGRRGLGATRQS